MSEKLHIYQEDIKSYINLCKNIYESIAKGARKHLGGLKGKTVLDLGVGFQLVHGGLPLALAIKEGAQRCFGIDVVHPDLHASDTNKVEFWKTAQEQLDIEVNWLEDQKRVIFASRDVLWTDDMFSKIQLLQMSASKMWFKDDFIDIALSNAVFEHIKRPKEVLKEVFRILKPGGGISINWNPYSGLRMGGHDLGIPYFYPWAHLRLTKLDHINVLKEVFSDKKLYTTALPTEHTPTDERAQLYAKDPGLFYEQVMFDLNKMRIPELIRMSKEIGFEIAESNYIIYDEDRKYLTDEIKEELSDFDKDELLQSFHQLVLKKPNNQN